VKEKNEALLKLDNKTLLDKYKDVVLEMGSLIQQCEPQDAVGMAEYFEKRIRGEILRRMQQDAQKE